MMYKLQIKALSVNESLAWSKRAGIYVKTKAAKKYREDLILILPKIIIPDGELTLIAIFGLSNANSDTDNLIKNFQDGLQAKYGFNDKRIKSYFIESEMVKKGSEFIEFSIIKKVSVRKIIF